MEETAAALKMSLGVPRRFKQMPACEVISLHIDRKES
jgi:hypothetical protein